MNHLCRSVLACCAVVAVAKPGISALVTFDLGDPLVTPTQAKIGVDITFEGDAPTDEIGLVQMSVADSDSILTSGNSDFSRFSFELNTSNSPLAMWDVSVNFTLGFISLAVTVPQDPIVGPFILPADTPLNLGVLTVDLSGIPDGTDLFVTLAGGSNPPNDTTFATNSAPPLVVYPSAFADPNGKSFTTNVPEPMSLIVWALLGTMGLVAARRWQRG